MSDVTFRSLVVLSVLACGCNSDDAAGTGKVQVQLEAEETISEGISKGEDVENARDYAVSYSKYLVAIGNVQLGKGSTGQQLKDGTIYIADLKQVGAQGVQLASFNDVSAGQWDEFGFELALPNANTRALGNVSQSDLQQMVDNGWTYWIEGTVERAQAEGGPVEFVLQTDVPTLFDRCGIDGQPGLAVVADGTATGTVTIHGDHLWFNKFPTGSEGTVERRSAWLVAADTDKDGKVDTADLALLDATDVFTTKLGYSLDGAPVVIESALDFVRAQLATQGHFKGEGECIWHFKGVDGE